MRFNLNISTSFGGRSVQKPPLKKGWLFVILVALFIPHWIQFYTSVQDTIAPDLLLRTIGSRLQEAKLPIYEYQWKPGDATSLLNPYPDAREGLNGVVSTPFMLWLLQPFSRVDYCTIKLWWGIIQQIILFAALWLCCITFKHRRRQILFIVVAACFFVYSRNWSLNVYNGQVYVFYAFTFSLAGYLISRYKEAGALALFVLMSTVRPFFITAVAPFFRFRKMQILYLLIAAVVSIAMVALTTTMNEWKQYNKAMQLYAKEQSNEITINADTATSMWRYADPCTTTPDASFTNFKAGCLYSFQHYLQLFNLSLSNVLVYQIILGIILLAFWWFAWKRKWLDDVPKQLLLCFVFYQLCELITPASRNPYNMIQWLPAVGWLIIWGDRKVIALLITGLLLNHDFPFRFAYQREIGEILMFLSVGLFLVKERKASNNHSAYQIL